MKPVETVTFNSEAVRRMSEAQFLKIHEHHADDVDLKAEYARITGAEPQKEAAKPAKGK